MKQIRNIFKIGEARVLEERLDANEYGNGTVILSTVKVNNRKVSEKLMKDIFKANKCIMKGTTRNEYFETSYRTDNEDDLCELWGIFAKFETDELCKTLMEEKFVTQYSLYEWTHYRSNNSKKNRNNKKASI